MSYTFEQTKGSSLKVQSKRKIFKIDIKLPIWSGDKES